MSNGSVAAATVVAGEDTAVTISLGDPNFCRFPEKILYDTANSFITQVAEHKRAYRSLVDALNAAGSSRLLVVVGHTDDVGAASDNDALSGRRAQGALAVLTGNTADWEANFNAERAQWGTAEFEMMLTEVNGTPPSATEVNEHRERSTDGEARRTALFTAYFHKLLGEPSAPPPVHSLTPATLACGERFTLASGADRDSRRSEFFFFRGSLPPAVNCEMYADWRMPCALTPVPTPPILDCFFVDADRGDDGGGDGSLTNPWLTIEHALFQIEVSRPPGRLVSVCLRGVFEENVTLPNDVILTSLGSPLAEIRGTDDAPTVEIKEVRQVDVLGVKIKGGRQSGIRVEEAQTIRIIDCEITDNFAGRGGGIAVVGSTDVTIEQNLINRNQAGTADTAMTRVDVNIDAAPIRCRGQFLAEIAAFDFRVGDGHGGGIYLENSREVRIDDNRIQENRAILFGGGIAVDNGSGFTGQIEIRENEITCNQVSHSNLASIGATGNECDVEDMGDPVLERIEDESAIDAAAGVAVKLLHGLGVEGGLGGGIALRHVNANTHIRGNCIGVSRRDGRCRDILSRANRARRGGGIACFVGAYPRIEGNTISNNLASDDGGGISIDQFDPFLPNNPAVAAEFPPANFPQMRRGPLFSRQPVRLVGNTITFNRAIEDGGGIYATGAVILEISGNTHIDFNRAGENGGGVRVSYASNLHANGTTFSHNEANLINRNNDKEGGGGLAARNATVFLESCHFEGNTAHAFAGGAIFANSLFEGGFNRCGFLENVEGFFDEIMRDDYRFILGRRYEFVNCSGIDNEATGSSGAGGFLYAVRDRNLGGVMPMHVSVTGTGTAIGINTSGYDNTANPGGRRQKRGNVVLELSGRRVGVLAEDSVFIDVRDVPDGITDSTPITDSHPVVVIHNDGSPDDHPLTFPYRN